MTKRSVTRLSLVMARNNVVGGKSKGERGGEWVWEKESEIMNKIYERICVSVCISVLLPMKINK